MVQLTLTHEQAEILGYALTLAKRNCVERKKRGSQVAAEQALRIEELREMLDSA